MEHDLGTHFPNKQTKNIIAAEQEFEQSFIHSITKNIKKDNNLVESVCQDTYIAFTQLAVDPLDTKVLAKIDALRVKFEALSEVYADAFFESEVKHKTNIKLNQEYTTQLESQLKSSADLANAEIDNLQNNNHQKEEKITQFEQQLQESRDKENTATTQLDSLQLQLKHSENNTTQLEQQLLQTQHMKDAALTQLDSLQLKLEHGEKNTAQLEQQLQKIQDMKNTMVQKLDSIQLQLKLSEENANQMENQLMESQNIKKQALTQVDILQQQYKQSEGRNNQLKQQLLLEKQSFSNLQNEINDLKTQNTSLSKEYEKLLQTFKTEQLTVIKPIYRNLYKTTGLLLRKTIPSTWVESIKKITPDPSGVPKQLTYQPLPSEGNNVSAITFSTPGIDAKPDILVLSIINWDFRYQRPQHIAKGLCTSGCRVFYLEMDFVESSTQLTKIDDNIYRVKLSSQRTGHIQAYTGQPSQQQTQAWIDEFYEFCETINATSFKRIIIQHPYWWQLARHLAPEFHITFDCMDDISGFSNTQQFLLDLEQDMLQKCDNLIVSSQYLFDKYKHFQTPALIRNAAEIIHFNSTETSSFLYNIESKIRSKDKIQIGYVGAIAEWFDVSLVKEVALNEPGFELHLCGAVTTKEAAKLNELDNINMYGEIPYSDVPGFLNDMDVLIIPFKIIPIIQACDPVKFYEYSAMGKPTVTSALPELARASELTFTGSNPIEFSEQIHRAYKAGKNPDFCMKLKNYAKRNTWDHRIEQFTKSLTDIPKVSIVILSYGDPELTKAALHSLYDRGSSYPNLEVLIVDNGSSSDALKEIKDFSSQLPNTILIENNENLGFAKGNNVGLNAATGEYIMLLNNDTVVAPGAIHAMCRHLNLNSSIGAIGSLTNNIGNEAKLFVDYENMEQMKDIARQATTGYRGVSSSINVLAYFAVMFRKSDLSIFGLLSEDYGRGMFEDDDHCAMIKSKGYSCKLAEDAYVHHHLSATFSKLKNEEREALFEKNKNTYEKKWGTWQPHQYREKRPKSSLQK